MWNLEITSEQRELFFDVRCRALSELGQDAVAEIEDEALRSHLGDRYEANHLWKLWMGRSERLETTTELATWLNRNKSSVSRLLNGKVHSLSLRDYIRYQVLLGAAPDLEFPDPSGLLNSITQGLLGCLASAGVDIEPWSSRHASQALAKSLGVDPSSFRFDYYLTIDSRDQPMWRNALIEGDVTSCRFQGEQRTSSGNTFELAGLVHDGGLTWNGVNRHDAADSYVAHVQFSERYEVLYGDWMWPDRGYIGVSIQAARELNGRQLELLALKLFEGRSVPNPLATAVRSQFKRMRENDH